MLKINTSYFHTELQKTVFLYDYIYYGGTNEHAFTFDYAKEIIPSKKIEEFLLKIKPIQFNKKNMDQNELLIQQSKSEQNYIEMQEILLETLKGLKDKKISPEQGKSIAIVAQTLVNSVKIKQNFNLPLK